MRKPYAAKFQQFVANGTILCLTKQRGVAVNSNPDWQYLPEPVRTCTTSMVGHNVRIIRLLSLIGGPHPKLE